MASRTRSKKSEFSVPEVWRRIVKLNERQGSQAFDVLVCGHAVAASDTAYRKFRACPECRVKVQKFAEERGRGLRAA
jgi:DNA-binding Lrp family transcriptional regulator